MKYETLKILFGISGASALIYELIWSRELQLVFGATTYTASAVFATFLLGFSLGAFITRKRSETTKSPLKDIANIEIAIGVYGILLTLAFNILPEIIREIPNLQIIKITLTTLILIIPTTLFGAIWPIIHKASVQDIEKLGRKTGQLYSSNSLGSALGVLAAGFILIPLLGIQLTALVAGITNISIGMVILGRRNK